MIGQKTTVANVGGIEGHVANLSAGLIDLGHEVTVFTRSRYGAGDEVQARVLQRPCVPSKHLEAISHAALCSFEAAARRFDVVHYHGVGPALTLPVASLSRRTATCVTVHDQDYNKLKWSRFARYWLRAGERTACRHADEVIVVARYLQRHLLEEYRRSAHYVPNGHDAIPLLPPGDTIAEHGLEPRKYLLFLARLVPEKGCDVLINALRQSSSPYRLAIVGGSSHSNRYADSLRELAAGDDRCVFLGHRTGNQLAEIRSNSACYVMPSYQEGLPLTLLEALWAGMPIIATDIPAVHEVDGTASYDTITVVPPGDVDALSAAIEALPYPGEPHQPGRMQWPSWRDIAEQVEHIYLGSRQPGAARRMLSTA